MLSIVFIIYIFQLDLGSLTPLDLLYLIPQINYNSLVRLPRLLKVIMHGSFKWTVLSGQLVWQRDTLVVIVTCPAHPALVKKANQIELYHIPKLYIDGQLTAYIPVNMRWWTRHGRITDNRQFLRLASSFARQSECAEKYNWYWNNSYYTATIWIKPNQILLKENRKANL